MCIYIYIYIVRHRLNRYLAQWVPSFVIASSFRICLDSEGLKGMFAWRTLYQFS